MENDTNGTFIVRGREWNVIVAGSSAKFVALSQEGQFSQIVEEQTEEEENVKEKSRN